MSKIKPVRLPGGRVLLMETDSEVEVPDHLSYPQTPRGGQDELCSRTLSDNIEDRLEDLAGTLESLTAYVQNAIRQAAGANVDKLTMRFGIKLAGDAGIPYIAKGSAEGNIEIQVECSFSAGSVDRR